MKLLFADDSKMAWKLFLNALEHVGDHHVDYAADGLEALGCYLDEGDYDAIFIDWNMPNMPGIETIRAIRKSDRDTPIIMVSGIAEQGHIREAFDAGINAYLQKPVMPEHLLQTFESILYPAWDEKARNK